jgi:acetylornithine deacetylase
VTTAYETELVDAIDPDDLRRDIDELVAIPSIGGSTAEVEVVAWCADRLRDLGGDVDHWQMDLDQLCSDPDFVGMEVDRVEAWGCVSDFGDASGRPALILNGHCDVVPPGHLGQWPDQDPYVVREQDGRLWGRGTCDMKAGFAAVIAAVRALRATGFGFGRGLAVHPVIGEEDGGLGTFATLRRGYTGDACLIAEPTDRAIVSANAGSLTFRLVVPGRATHGSTRTRGVSAVEKFELIHHALRALESERNRDLDGRFAHLDLGWPLSVGKVSAGEWASTVPDRLIAEGRYGVRPGESIADAKHAFDDVLRVTCAADSWLADHPAEVSWPGGVFASGELPEGNPFGRQVARVVADVTGTEPDDLGGPYGSDLRLYADAGIPTVQYGPGEVRYAHATDEQVDFAEVVRCAKVYAVLAARCCT